MDLYGRVRLAELLRKLATVDGIEWIRVLYAYPIHFTDELIDTLAGTPKVIPYLDLPLQHINNRMLRRMQRRVNREETESLLTRLRSAIPRRTLASRRQSHGTRHRGRGLWRRASSPRPAAD